MLFDDFIAILTPKTAEAYKEDLNDFSRWFESSNGVKLAPELVTSVDLKEYQSYLINVRLLKPATVNRRLAAIKSWLRWCLENNLIEAIPRFPRRVEEVQQAPKALSKTEQSRFLRAVEREGNERDKALIGLLLFAGLRVGETIRLKVSDIELSERKGKVTIRSGKGMKRREVPLGPDAREYLRPWVSKFQGEKKEGWLFPGQEGKHISARAVQQMIKKYAWSARLDPEKVTPHVLRHTFATRLLREGKDLVIVAALLGHARLDTTARYTRPSYQAMEQAVDDFKGEY